MSGSFFLKMRQSMKKRLGGFGRDRKGAITVEMAFILPIFASMAFLTYDAGTVYTQYKRGTRHYYAIGDLLSAQTKNITCNQLDKMSDLVYASYAAGNWARRPRPTGVDFTVDGALDFRFVVRMLEAEKQSDGQIKGRVKWVYFRTPNDMDTPSEAKPGDLINIPSGLQIEGTEYVQINGRLFIAPALNYLGIFDYNKANDNVTHKQVPITRYFPLRFMTGLNVYEVAGTDEFDDKCSDGSNYP